MNNKPDWSKEFEDMTDLDIMRACIKSTEEYANILKVTIQYWHPIAESLKLIDNMVLNNRIRMDEIERRIAETPAIEMIDFDPVTPATQRFYPCDMDLVDPEAECSCPYDAHNISDCQRNCNYGVDDDIEDPHIDDEDDFEFNEDSIPELDDEEYMATNDHSDLGMDDLLGNKYDDLNYED